jgi:hypothetical protein
MSIVVTVKRTEASPLSREEMVAALSNSSVFTQYAEHSWKLVGDPTVGDLFVNVDDDSLWTDGSTEWLEQHGLESLRALAAELHGRVLDEEGGDLTSGGLESNEPPPPFYARLLAPVYLLVSLLLLPVLFVVAIVKVPWVLWRLSRTK